MTQEKMFLILGVLIIILLFLNVYRFINKNKDSFQEIKKKKSIYVAKVVDKRHYTENNHNLFYVTFLYEEITNEFLVNKYLYNEIQVNQVGTLVLKDDYFYDFK